MTSSLFGWNINAAESPEDKVLDIVRRTKARSHTVMHGMGLARKVYDITGQVTGEQPVIVCREDWPDQDWNKFRDVRGYVSGWKGRGGYWPGAYNYFLNEPVVGGDVNKVKDLLRVCIDFMNEAARQGLKAVIGNFPDASLFEHHWLDSGVFDEFLRVASQWTNAGHGYIGHHNYSYGTSWTGSAGVPYSQLKTTNPQPPTKDAFQRTKARENWLQGRFMFPLLRCDALGIPRYRFVCTEAVWDRMPNGEAEGWIPGTEAFWGLGKLRGPLDQRQLWAKLFPTLSQAKAGVNQLETLAALMEGLPCVGVQLFTLSRNPEWATFNFLNWTEFVDELAAYAGSLSGGPVSNPIPAVPKPASAGTGIPAVLQASDFINLRNAPDTKGAIVQAVNRGTAVTHYPSTERTNVYQWRWVEVGSGTALKGGWMARVWPTWEQQFAPPWPADKSVMLGVPFAGQRNTGTANNCLEAAFTMLLNYWRQEVSAGAPVLLSNVIAFVNNNGTFGNLTDATKLIDHYELPALVKTNQSLETLRAELDASRAFVALVNRGKLPGTQAYFPFVGSHFVTVIGYDKDGVIFHDPLGTAGGAGDEYKVTPTAFDAAWETTPGNAGKYQAIMLKPEALTTPPPETRDFEALYNEQLLENSKLRLRIQNAIGNVEWLIEEGSKALKQLEGTEG